MTFAGIVEEYKSVAVWAPRKRLIGDDSTVEPEVTARGFCVPSDEEVVTSAVAVDRVTDL